MRVPTIRKAPQFEIPQLHPEGVFDAKLVEWADIRRGKSVPFVMPAVLETSFGKVWVFFNGSLDLLVLTKRAEAYYKKLPFKVRVKHVEHGGATIIAADMIVPMAEDF